MAASIAAGGVVDANGEPLEDKFIENVGARRFLVKRQLHARPVGESADVLNQRIMMMMSARELVWGFHNVEEDQAASLLAAATIIQAKSAASLIAPLPIPKAESPTDSFIVGKFDDAPVNLVATKKTDARRFAKLVEQKRMELSNNADYLSFLSSMRSVVPTFGAQFYRVQRNDECNLKLPDDVVLAINYYGVFVLEVKSRAQLYHYTLLQVLGWSHSPVRVVIKVKLEEKGQSGTATLKFNTHNPRMGKEICDLLLAYANEMLKAVQAQKKT